MKAVYRTKYGSPEVLSIKEVAVPDINENEILVKVLATTVNRTDCAILKAQPFLMRFFTGLLKPRSPIPGTDFAGIVEKAGKQATTFKAGDRVFGFNDQGIASQAQYMSIREDKAISIIPENINFQQAAASLEGVHYALNFINKISIKPGQKILVNGATGAIGSASIQMLKYLEADVTATCSTQNIDLVKSMGADKVIDYTREDFTKVGEKFDYVFDSVGKSTFGKCKPLLSDKGIYISSELGPMIQNPFLALFTPLSGGKKVIFPIPLNTKASIMYIKGLIEKGKFKPLIDRVYNLAEIREAYNYAGSGQKTGNVILDFS
ncbi:NAD(P)-dependent alcohol dehydrogenase [soil metagenome]